MIRCSRRVLVAALVAVLAAAGATFAVARDRVQRADRVFTLRPDPAGNPEGIAVGNRSTAFFVSITGDGAIYRGTLRSGTVAPFIAGAPGKVAVGIKVRRGLLYVAGGPTGTITVYGLANKRPVATFQTGSGGFLNDLVVTRRGDVYVTDSYRPTLWHVTAAQVRAGHGVPQALDVSSAIAYLKGFNANGIVAQTLRRLIVVQTNTGRLFRITLNAAGSAIAAIAPVRGVAVPGGDGLMLDAGRLVVVQGGPPAQLSFVQLRDAGRRGSVRARLRSDKLRGPSTVARARGLYLVVNADFANSAKPFTIAGLRRAGRR
jgi:Cu-Zn family superoxide dismutase